MVGAREPTGTTARVPPSGPATGSVLIDGIARAVALEGRGPRLHRGAGTQVDHVPPARLLFGGHRADRRLRLAAGEERLQVVGGAVDAARGRRDAVRMLAFTLRTSGRFQGFVR